MRKRACDSARLPTEDRAITSILSAKHNRLVPSDSVRSTITGATMTILSSPVQYVASTPPVTRAFTAVTVVLSLLYYWVSWASNDPYVAPYLILVPGTSIFYPWSFLTAGLVETSLIEVCDLLDSATGHSLNPHRSWS
jgi:hypothetical protein